MRILFTGASSFTGYWFIKELTSQGHEVVAILRKKPEEYIGTRALRVQQLSKIAHCHFEYETGSDNFLKLILTESPFDLFCHHAAEMTNYKSPDFDPLEALARNVKNFPQILQTLIRKECNKMVVSGSYFEQNESSLPYQEAIGPYALSKGLTFQLLRFYASKFGIEVKKFVISNPFGPYEEERFTSYLVRSWKQGVVPTVSTPLYIRDNIHVDLLAKVYCTFVQNNESHFYPSGYIESQNHFAERFSQEMQKRLNIPCPFKVAHQTQILEPISRFNSNSLNPIQYDWNEESAWNQLAKYYEQAL